jgi:formylglycine-generating enzyme required for sulfatase activity
MYSHAHSIIEDYETDWTVREINYAQSLKKRIVFINIDGSPFTKYFIFMFPQKQQVDATSENAKNKLCRDLKTWLKIENPVVKPNMVGDSRYKDVNAPLPQPIITKKNVHAQEDKEVVIDSPNKPSKIVKEDNNHSRQIVKQDNTCTKTNVRSTQTLRRGWLWIVGFAGLLVIALLLYVFWGNHNDSPNSITLVDSLDFISTDTTSYFEGHEVLTYNKIPDDFILVSGGSFSYKGNFYENYKVHKTKIDSFYICKYELTQGEYQRVMGCLNKENYLWLVQKSWYLDKGPQYSEVKGDSIPVRGNYKLFAEYCNTRSEQEGYDGFYEINGDSIKVLPDGNGYRLVTPYEWIFAAYGGTLNKIERYLGGKTLSDVAWHYGNSKNKPHPVGLKNPNVIGIYDMQGNAPELLQGDKKRKCYVSMCGGYNVSDWNYQQTYDPTYIWSPGDDDSEWTYGTRVVLVPTTFKNDNLKVQYDY